MSLYQTFIGFEPILLSTQIEDTTDENLRQYLDEQTLLFEQLARDQIRCISVIDCSFGTSVTAVQRAMYADWMKASKPLLDACLVGTAYVMPSVLVRGALTAIFWLTRLSTPHAVHRELDEGLRWAIDLAKRSDLRLHPSLEREGAAAFRRVRSA